MAPKRKTDVALDDKENGTLETFFTAPATKKARVSDASSSTNADASSSTSNGKSKGVAPASWEDVTLEGEDDHEVPVYDDCNEIRRKIRLLQKEPGFKITHWLKEIGKINSNSFSRFMKESGPTGGAGNGTYYAAYVYFEKVRIATGKKMTAKRIRNEEERPNGLPLSDRKGMWVIARR